MERVFQVLAAVLIGAAAVFYLRGNFDGVFISIVLGCLSFFLSVRFQVKGRLAAREAERSAEASITDGEIEPAGTAAAPELEERQDQLSSER